MHGGVESEMARLLFGGRVTGDRRKTWLGENRLRLGVDVGLDSSRAEFEPLQRQTKPRMRVSRSEGLKEDACGGHEVDQARSAPHPTVTDLTSQHPALPGDRDLSGVGMCPELA